MRITHIETHAVRIPLVPAKHMITALGKHTESPYLIVRIGTDAGIDGAGEATATPNWSGETIWGTKAIIDHVFAPHSPESRMDRTLGLYGLAMTGPESTRTNFAGWPFVKKYMQDLPGAEQYSIEQILRGETG